MGRHGEEVALMASGDFLKKPDPTYEEAVALCKANSDKTMAKVAEMDAERESFKDIAARWAAGNMPEPNPEDEVDA